MAINRANPAVKLSMRSDKDGRVAFKLPQDGMWLIKAVHMIRGAGRLWRPVGQFLGVVDVRVESSRTAGRRQVGRSRRDLSPKAIAVEKRPVLLFLLLALCASVTAQAHEIGTTRVAVSLAPDRTYRIEVVTDAASLVAKLLAAAGAEPAAPLGAEDLQQKTPRTG